MTIEVFGLCLVIFLLITALMAIGLLSGRRVKGSCGGVTGECSVCGNENAEDKTVIKGEEKLNRPEPTRYGTWESKGREVDF